MSREDKKDPYSFDVVDAMIVGGAAASGGLGLPPALSPKNSWSRITTGIGLTLAAVSGVLLYKWAKHQLTSRHKDVQNTRPATEEVVGKILASNDPSAELADILEKDHAAGRPTHFRDKLALDRKVDALNMQLEIIKAQQKNQADWINKAIAEGDKAQTTEVGR